MENSTSNFLVIGLVGAVGSRLKPLSNILKSTLEDTFKYHVEEVRISELFLKKSHELSGEEGYTRYEKLMDEGNDKRKKHGNSILAKKAIGYIYSKRRSLNKVVFIINSLKHDEEINLLRSVYGKSFFQISLYESPEARLDALVNEQGITELQAKQIMARDESEKNDFGQHTRAAFHLADYFIKYDNKNNAQIKNSCLRFLELIFGNPYITPTFNEFAMYMAFTSSLKSADLSRQVGAVLAYNRNIISTGANDIPKYGGGQYWPEYNDITGSIEDIDHGRDYMKGYDSNEKAKDEMMRELEESISGFFTEYFSDQDQRLSKNKNKLLEIIKNSSLKDITEYGRMVHAEMDALISCGRTNNSTLGSSMYVTTFPCHNCAKHIIAAGVKDVVFIEPYPKSKALDFWSDSLSLKGMIDISNKVLLAPFVGVGPRSFLDLFSMSQGAGGEIIRKKHGEVINWRSMEAKPRLKANTMSLGELEKAVVNGLAELED